MQTIGIVQKRIIAKGSKSERPAVVLVTPDGEYILRRSHGPPFADPTLESWIGRHVCCEGTLLPGATFQFDKIVPVEDPD